jgi:hypothetical protein
MVFPLFSLLSLSTTDFFWASSILISSYRAIITRFIPVGPDALYWTSPTSLALPLTSTLPALQVIPECP